MGAQAYYIANCDVKNLQPMNANFGIMVLREPCHKRDRKAKFAEQSARRMEEIRQILGETSREEIRPDQMPEQDGAALTD